MVRVKTETFTVKTVGAGQPDYAQPQVVAGTTQAIIVKYPETEISGEKYGDYAEVSFGSGWTEYVIGTNANASKSGSWPSGQLARAIQFYATEDCEVKFNDMAEQPWKILASQDIGLVKSNRRTERIFVRQLTNPGKLYMWIEG